MAGAIKLPIEDYSDAGSDAGLVEAEAGARGDAADIETASAIALDLDTTLAQPKRNRRKNCCVCCGLNCSLFCKALGALVAILVLWNTFKFARWMLTPTPTGTESIPAFSTSLGCLGSDARYISYPGGSGAYYLSIPYVNASFGEIAVQIDGGAPGTVTLAPLSALPPNERNPEVKDGVYGRVVMRSADPEYNSGVIMRARTSTLQLTTPPRLDEDACARFDMTLYLPSSLRTLSLKSTAETQLQFDFPAVPAQTIALESLKLTLANPRARNLLLPSAGLAAAHVELSAAGGYVSGGLALANEASVLTTVAAIVKLDVTTVGIVPPSEDAADPQWNIARLTTSTSAMTSISLANTQHRPLLVSHVSTTDAELRLDYARASFNGLVDMRSVGYTMRGVQSDGVGPTAEKWAGDKDGGDRMEVRSKGWVGVYF